MKWRGGIGAHRQGGGEALHMQCSTKEEDKRQLGAVGLIRRKDDAFFMGECLLN